MEIQRHNIFELIGGRQNLYHSAIFTSYTFDPIFFESFFLPKLRQCGISNIVVMLDSSNYDKMLLQYPAFGIESDRRLYTLVRQPPTGTGVFHPKISMLFGDDTGMLAVGSGNLTYNGHALNEEIWNTFSLKGVESVYVPLFNAVWQYLNKQNLTGSTLLRQQMLWMSDNTSWVSSDSTKSHHGISVENEYFSFLANDSDGNILSKMQTVVGDETVKSITTISPFYDTSGFIVKELYDLFKPVEINCVYSETGTYPYDLIKENPQWLTMYSWDDVFTSKRSDIHRLHAKIIQMRLSTRTLLISGSANLTTAALHGVNGEACILITSGPDKDYIKELGISLGQKSAAGPDKLERLEKPERVQMDSTYKSIQILCAETVDDTLKVTTNIPADQHSRLQILDTEGNVLTVLEIGTSDRILQFKEFTLTDCIAVIIDPDNTEISNRFLIINEDDVVRFNPNKALRKLDSLLESDKDWKDNIAGILSYLWFDNSYDSRTSISKSCSAYVKEESFAKSVSSEVFDNIRTGSRQAVLSLPDVRIIDFLLSSERKPELADQSESSDDTDAVEDIDNGNNEYQNSEHIVEKRKQDASFTDCIDNYSRRLRKHYDMRLAELYTVAAHYGADIFKKDFNDKTCDVNVMDYSRILIDIVLMWRELMRDIKGHHGNIRHDFITNLGKFLLLARKGYAKTNDYAGHKCIEFQRELIVFSLLIIAVQDWYGRERVAVKLIVANLLYSCTVSGVIGIDEVLNLFDKKITETGIAAKPALMALIEKTVAEYENFEYRTAQDDKAMVRTVDFNNPEGNYSFRKGYGFFYVTDIEPVQQSARNSTVFDMSLYHPGFDEIVKVRGGRKIRALN